MEILVLVLTLIVNVAISLWNCYATGRAWRDVMTFGSGWQKFTLWSGATQAAIGFSMPILAVLGFAVVAYLRSDPNPSLTPAEELQLLEWAINLWYVAVIVPVLGTGLALTAHAWRAAFQRRNFASFLAAGWNSYAMVHNAMHAAEHIGPALGSVGKLFATASGGRNSDARGKLAILAILIAIAAILAGVFLTFFLIRYFMRRSTSRIEQHADDLARREHNQRTTANETFSDGDEYGPYDSVIKPA